MGYNACCFFGHGEMDFTDELKEKVKNKLIELIEKENYGVFKFGGISAFDYGCWELVKELKEQYPHIKTVLCLWEGKRPWWAKYRKCDETEDLILDFDYWYTRIYYRNTAMIDTSNYCIFYVNRTENSGAYKAMKYAISKKRPFTNFGTVSLTKLKYNMS